MYGQALSSRGYNVEMRSAGLSHSEVRPVLKAPTPCSRRTKSMKKKQTETQIDYRCKDRAILWTLFHDHELTQEEMSVWAGCSQRTISNWMQELNVPANRISTKRSPTKRKKRAHTKSDGQIDYRQADAQGYERWDVYADGSWTSVLVHRLLAVAEYGCEALHRDMDIHHKNGIQWDNRPDNIAVMDHADHARMHSDDRIERDEKGRFV